MEPGISGKRARLPVILIIEDGRDTRDLWVLAFHDAGFRVLVADSMAAGLALLGGDEPIDVVLCDYWLVDGTAEALLREATRLGRLQTARALICTAHGSVTASAYAPVIHKPISPDDLIARVRVLLPSFPGSPAVA